MTLTDDLDRLEQLLAHQIAVDPDSQDALDRANARVEGAHVGVDSCMAEGEAHWVACKCGDVIFEQDTERLSKKFAHHVTGTALNPSRTGKERL